MAYNENDVTLLKHLVDLATRVNAQGYQNATQVQALIDASLTTVYKPGGTKTATQLVDTTTPLLVAGNEGKVYDISTELTITAQIKDMFVEGLEGTYPVGTNFVVINTAASGSTAVYKFDALPGFVDLSGYATKISSPTANNLVKQDASGNIADAGIAAGDVVTKITSATADNLVAQDANGKIADAGIAKGDVVTKISSPTADNLVAQDSNGKIADAGIAKGDVVTKLTTFTAGNIIKSDANGKIADGGVAASNIMQKVASATATNFALLNASGEVVDGGFNVATDAEVDEALDTIFPTT